MMTPGACSHLPSSFQEEEDVCFRARNIPGTSPDLILQHKQSIFDLSAGLYLPVSVDQTPPVLTEQQCFFFIFLFFIAEQHAEQVIEM